MPSTLADFQFRGRLGKGSFGEVFQVVRLLDNGVYVMKQIHMDDMGVAEQQAAVKEVHIMAALDCTYVVRYYDSFIEDGILCIVMEYCDRGDMQRMIKKQGDVPIPEPRVWILFLQVLLGLAYLHAHRTLHRDLKSANVFLCSNNRVKIGDLGVARVLGTETYFAKTVCGTPYYLSPELVEGHPYNEKSDCWALGCILYELCTLRHAFDAKNHGALVLKIIQGAYPPIADVYSPLLAHLVALLLTRDSAMRPNAFDVLLMPEIQVKVHELGLEVPEDVARVLAAREEAAAAASAAAGTSDPRTGATFGSTISSLTDSGLEYVRRVAPADVPPEVEDVTDEFEEYGMPSARGADTDAAAVRMLSRFVGTGRLDDTAAAVAAAAAATTAGGESIPPRTTVEEEDSVPASHASGYANAHALRTQRASGEAPGYAASRTSIIGSSTSSPPVSPVRSPIRPMSSPNGAAGGLPSPSVLRTSKVAASAHGPLAGAAMAQLRPTLTVISPPYGGMTTGPAAAAGSHATAASAAGVGAPSAGAARPSTTNALHATSSVGSSTPVATAPDSSRSAPVGPPTPVAHLRGNRTRRGDPTGGVRPRKVLPLSAEAQRAADIASAAGAAASSAYASTAQMSRAHTPAAVGYSSHLMGARTPAGGGGGAYSRSGSAATPSRVPVPQRAGGRSATRASGTSQAGNPVPSTRASSGAGVRAAVEVAQLPRDIRTAAPSIRSSAPASTLAPSHSRSALGGAVSNVSTPIMSAAAAPARASTVVSGSNTPGAAVGGSRGAAAHSFHPSVNMLKQMSAAMSEDPATLHLSPAYGVSTRASEPVEQEYEDDFSPETDADASHAIRDAFHTLQAASTPADASEAFGLDTEADEHLNSLMQQWDDATLRYERLVEHSKHVIPPHLMAALHPSAGVPASPPSGSGSPSDRAYAEALAKLTPQGYIVHMHMQYCEKRLQELQQEIEACGLV